MTDPSIDSKYFFEGFKVKKRSGENLLKHFLDEQKEGK